MKFPNLYILIVLFLVFFGIGCDTVDSNDTINGSGFLVSNDQNISDFTKIETGFAFESTIRQDSLYKITVTADDNIIEYVRVFKEGSTLKVLMDEDKNYSNATLKVDITLPDVENINLSGASASVISGFNFIHDLDIQLSGASSVEGSISTGDLTLELSGASAVSLSGSGIDLNINGSGASVLNLGQFALSDDASIILSGASVSTIRLEGTLDAVLSGASVLSYYGNPTLGNIVTSGESVVQKL